MIYQAANQLITSNLVLNGDAVPNSLIHLLCKLINETPSIKKALSTFLPTDSLLFHTSASTIRSNFKFTAHAGLSGTNWQIQFMNLNWIARENNLEKKQLGICRTREAKILKLIASLDQSPKFVTLSQEWLIVEWLPSGGQTADEYDSHHIINQIGERTHQLHSFRLSQYRITLKTRFAFLLSQVSHNRLTHNWIKNHNKLTHSLPHQSKIVLAHLDVHPGNIVRNHNKIYLIDWEYAGDIEEHIALISIIESMNWSYDSSYAFIKSYLTPKNSTYRIAENEIDVKVDCILKDIEKWRPYLHYLQFLWYEIRWQQTQDERFLNMSQEIRNVFA